MEIEQETLLVELRQRLSESQYPHKRVQIDVEQNGSGPIVKIRGTTGSFFYKQMLQEIVLRVLRQKKREWVLHNEVEVETLQAGKIG
jgi:hypothetical protein